MAAIFPSESLYLGESRFPDFVPPTDPPPEFRGTTVSIGGITCSDVPGAVDGYGVQWICEELSGWGSPAGTLEVVQRSGDHGGWDGDSYLQPRVMEIKGTLVAPDRRSAIAAVDRLIVAVPLSATPLTVDESGLVRSCMVRRQDDVLCTWRSGTVVEWSAQVVAPDPRRYGAQQTASTGLPSSSGGLRWPAVTTVLNANPYFETDASSWTALNGTVTRSTAEAHEGAASLLCTPNGVSTSVEARAESVAVAVGRECKAGAWLRCDVARNASVGIIWRDSGGALLSSASTPTSLLDGTWAYVSHVATAPVGAAQGQLFVSMGGTPPSSHLLYIDEATLSWVSGGLRWPQRWDAVVTSGVIAAENPGTIGTRPRLVIAGPCMGPRVALVGSGRQLAWDLTLAAGQWLDVDLDRRTSLLNGQVSRSGAMTERGWFELPAGARSELAFAAVGYDPAALVTAVWRPAWQ